ERTARSLLGHRGGRPDRPAPRCPWSCHRRGAHRRPRPAVRPGRGADDRSAHARAAHRRRAQVAQRNAPAPARRPRRCGVQHPRGRRHGPQHHPAGPGGRPPRDRGPGLLLRPPAGRARRAAARRHRGGRGDRGAARGPGPAGGATRGRRRRADPVRLGHRPDRRPGRWLPGGGPARGSARPV
ncbi:MAG: 16S rRNA processing protein RimM, partial [uncultured Blastococcus sp.]